MDSENLDQISELSDFNYNRSWFLFQCRCGLGFNKIRKALRHLNSEHKIQDLQDKDIHIKLRGKFFCDCGNKFASDQVSVIYQNETIRSLKMGCLKCGKAVSPMIICSGRKVSENVLTLVCRWKLTMKQIQTNFIGKYKHMVDHKKEVCEACQLGICINKGMINYDPNNCLNVKKFFKDKHQVASLNKTFEVMTICDSVISGATSQL